VTAGNVEVDVDGRDASLKLTARPSPKHLVRRLLASHRPDGRKQVHVHVQVDAVMAYMA
jgi:hypothetical protein